MYFINYQMVIAPLWKELVGFLLNLSHFPLWLTDYLYKYNPLYEQDFCYLVM